MPETIPEIREDPTSRLKVPPHSVEAEQSVLGALMLNNDAWFNIADKIEARDFYRAAHQIIFEVMGELANDNQPLDAVTLSEALQSRGLIDKAGGNVYLAELVESVPGASNIIAYADIVREHQRFDNSFKPPLVFLTRRFCPRGERLPTF